MNEKENIEQNELISAFIDQQLSPRQLTELKRLLLHHSALKEEIESLQNIKQLLRSLPIETAPKELAQEIQSSLERKYILDTSTHRNEKAGVWGLRLRRFAATAAMILIPLLVLSAVVYTILQPQGEQAFPADTVQPNIALSDNQSDVDNSSPSYITVLKFRTSQPTAVTDYIGKKIQLSGLANYSISNRQPETSSYRITCSKQNLSGFVGQLTELWPQCQKVSCSIFNHSNTCLIETSHVEYLQALAIIDSVNVSSAVQLAQNFNQQNLLKTHPNLPSTETVPEKPGMPILAWDEGYQPPTEKKGVSQDTNCLVIEIVSQ